ncbi:MAG TPA: hypothetical protein VFC44_21870 [Candidatus Saccharimonadales bacterium]|nr:hypothetical protein [Candidatus Saccharimonadales bacterium]
MSTKAQAILEAIGTLAIGEQRALLLELEQRIGQAPPVLYGEPLTDEDIEQSGRVTFQMLDEEDKHASSR